MNSEIMVSILCMTYNHKDYIEKTLDGFIRQKCSFDYEILVHDDASTDNTQEILKKYEMLYPNKIKVVYQKENQYSKGIIGNQILMQMSKGKYIALCEGDDYWNDSNKLERQINFLEQHKDYSACVHAGYYAYEDGIIKRKMFRAFHNDCDVSQSAILENWLFPTASIVYRQSCRVQYDLGYGSNLPCGDFPLMVYLSDKGKIYYFDIPMCVYRTMSKSSISRLVSNNPEKLKIQDEKYKVMLSNIDSAQNYRNHNSINRNLIKREFERNVAQCNWKKIHELKYAELYKNLGFIKKTQIYLVYKFPKAGKKLEKLLIYIRDNIEYMLDKQYTKRNSIER